MNITSITIRYPVIAERLTLTLPFDIFTVSIAAPCNAGPASSQTVTAIIMKTSITISVLLFPIYLSSLAKVFLIFLGFSLFTLAPIGPPGLPPPGPLPIGITGALPF